MQAIAATAIDSCALGAIVSTSVEKLPRSVVDRRNKRRFLFTERHPHECPIDRIASTRQRQPYARQTGDRYVAMQTRFNLALTYLGAAEREASKPRQRDLLLRAQAFAEATLRQFQQDQSRAASDEAKVQRLHAAIAQAPA